MTHATCRLTAKNWDELQNPTLGNRVWATFFVSKQDQTNERVIHSSSYPLREAWLYFHIQSSLSSYQGTPAGSLKVLESVECKNCKFKVLKVLENEGCPWKSSKSPGIWFVGFGKFRLDNGRLFVWTFCHLTVNCCKMVVFSLDYLLQIIVDCSVNLASCRS